MTDTWLERANALSDDWQGLLDLCGDWTKNDPENVDAWARLGVAYGGLDRHVDAIGAYREALRIDPEKDADSWLNLAISYALSGDRITALESVRELRRLNPEMADKLFNLIVPL